MQPPIGICKYIICTPDLDSAMTAADKRGLQIYQWEWHPAEKGEHWYIYEQEVKRQNRKNYLQGKKDADELELGQH